MAELITEQGEALFFHPHPSFLYRLDAVNWSGHKPNFQDIELREGR